MKQWYETLFENYARKYDGECFVHGTSGECDFIEQELDNNKALKILDIGCGTGRHSIELTKRGYDVTGIDLSESQIKRAREKAKEQGVDINFKIHDARNIFSENEFDIAIMLCEGGFSLMETDEMNFDILKNVTKALKANAKFIFTTLNALFPLYNSVEKFYSEKDDEGNATYKSNTFDLMALRDHKTIVFEDDLGNKKEITSNERHYMPSEITWLLKTLGYKKIDIFGAKLGAFSRDDELTTEDFEILVVGQK